MEKLAIKQIMKPIVLNYYHQRAVCSNTNEAANFINSLKGISANAPTIKNLDDYFEGTNKFSLNEIATTGCGRNRIYVYAALAESIQEHDLIVAKLKSEREAQEKIRKEKIYQDFCNEAYSKLKGWYEVTIKYLVQDFEKGGYKTKYLNGRLIAESIADAYHKGCQEIEKKGGEFEEDMQNALINYVGVLTDEYLLNEENYVYKH